MTILHLFLGMGVIFFGIWLHVYVRPYILRHRLRKGPLFMNERDDETDIIRNPARVKVSPVAEYSGTGAPPPEHSINDVQEQRAQDNNLAVLAAQYEDMMQPPWREKVPEPASPPARTLLRYLATALSRQMTAPGSVGSNRSVALAGEMRYVDFGSNKIWASSKVVETTYKELLKQYYEITTPNRAVLLTRMRELMANPGESVPPPPAPKVVACGQTEVVVLDDIERSALIDRLNASYFSLVGPALAELRRDILNSIAAKP